MKTKVTLILLVSVVALLQAAAQKPSDPFAHTYSIVARDARTGEMAVAVQSHWFSVGTVVAWGEAGIGVVATQSFVNKSFGILGLDLLSQGKTAQQALDELLSKDEGREFRQVAILGKTGMPATFTGKSCIQSAGQATGDDFSVQANMMLNDKVIPAMEKAWKENNSLPLAERMIRVLIAAQSVGGDIRGKQSAALLVVAGEKSDQPWNDRLIDLRVDDSTNPIKEIDRLLKVYRAYEHMNQGDLYVEKNEMEKAMQEYGAAMKMFPDNLEMQYWTAITLANNKQVDKAQKMLSSIYQKDSNWRELTKRLPKVGLLNVSDAELKALTK